MKVTKAALFDILLVSSFLITQAGCVGNAKESTTLGIEYASTPQLAQISAVTNSGLAKYTFGGQKHESEWLTCVSDRKVRGAFVLVNPDDLAFDANKFCEGWLAQTFLNEGFAILAVNRPGFGNSTGQKDFGGEQSVEAIHAAMRVSQNEVNELPALKGIWGCQWGAVAAAFAGKKDTLDYLVIGNGIFDLESLQESSTGKLVRQDIETIVNVEGEDGVEVRSIAWDVEGLPKYVFLYHGRDNEEVSYRTAESFRDNLATAEYKVNLRVLDQIDYQLKDSVHSQIIQVTLRAIP